MYFIKNVWPNVLQPPAVHAYTPRGHRGRSRPELCTFVLSVKIWFAKVSCLVFALLTLN